MKAEWRRVFAILCCSVLLLTAAFAQETTGAIQGVVKDPSGAVVPNATVEISSPALMGVRTLQTDSGGYYRAANLPLGVYSVAVTASGFTGAKRSSVQVVAGRTETIDIAMTVGGTEQVVEVSAEGTIIQPTESKAQTNISNEVISSIPKGRNYLSLIDFAPGARSEPLQGGSTASQTATAGYQIDGASNSENAYLVEGMDTSAIRTGRAGVDVPFEFVQEVQIKSSGFEAEHGGALGGVINVIQKRGGNDWHGQVLMHWRGDMFDANPNKQVRLIPGQSVTTVGGAGTPNARRVQAPYEYWTPKEDERTILEPGFEVGGSLVKNRLWLFSSYIPRLDWQNRTVNFNCTTGSCATIPPGASQSQIGPRNFSQHILSHNALNRLDFLAFDKLRLFASWQYSFERVRGISQPGQDPVNPAQINPSRTSDPRAFRAEQGTVSPNNVWTFGADLPITNSFVWTARYGYWKNSFGTRGQPVGLRYVYTASTPASVPAQFQGPSGFQNIPSTAVTNFDTYTRKTFTTDGAYFKRGFLGTHNFKVGYQLNQLGNNTNINSQPQGLVVLQWGTSVSGQIGTYGTYYMQHFETVGSVASNNHSIFAQDSWTVGKGLTLNLGVRFDSESLPSYAPGLPGIEFGFMDKIAPRIGAAWDVMQNGKWKIYGSYGLFYDIMKYELPRGSFGGDYWHNCYYTLDDPDYTKIVPTPDANGRFCPASGGASGALTGTFITNTDFRHPSNDPADNTIDPDLKPMRQAEYIIGSDYAINDRLGLEIRYARKRLHRTIEDVGNFVNIGGNEQEIYIIGNPGEGVLKLPAGCPTCQVSPKAVRNYDGIEFRLTKRASKNWFGTVSYTYSRLYGNYSGLTSTDESGRGSPNVNRFFDLPFMGFTATGKYEHGPLATDRPHTFKAFGYYNLRWLGMETLVGATQLAYSGTPITTWVPLVSTDTSFQPAVQRGVWQEFTQDRTTGIVTAGATKSGLRTPMFSQTDFVFTHEIKVSKSNENLRLGFEFNALNVFDQREVLRTEFRPTSGAREVLNPCVGGTLPCNSDYLRMTTSGYSVVAGLNGNNAAAGFPASATSSRNILFNPMYGQPNLFQSPRTMRLAVRFKF